MKSAVYNRSNHLIQNVESGNLYNFPSISSAKRVSRAYQKAHGFLGDGSIRLVEKLGEATSRVNASDNTVLR